MKYKKKMMMKIVRILHRANIEERQNIIDLRKDIKKLVMIVQVNLLKAVILISLILKINATIIIIMGIKAKIIATNIEMSHNQKSQIHKERQ